jgi:hypothetical protein
MWNLAPSELATAVQGAPETALPSFPLQKGTAMSRSQMILQLMYSLNMSVLYYRYAPDESILQVPFNLNMK